VAFHNQQRLVTRVEGFGIAGYGGRGRLIARKLAEFGFNVQGVYDSNPTQLSDVPFRTFTDLDALLKLDLSAVAIATWPSSHAKIAERALERGLDIFVEKPMGASIDQSLQIVQAQKRSGRLAVVGYVERLNPAIMKLREITDLTDVIRSREIRIGMAPPSIDGAGVLLDLGSHSIDMAYHLFGAEPKVRSAILTAEQEGKPEYECMVELDCGSTRSYVEVRRANIRRRRLELDTDREYYEVTYTPSELKIGFSPPKLRKRPQSFEDLERLSKNVETTFEIRREEPINIMLHRFVESVKNGSVIEPLCSAEEALVTARAIDSAKRVAAHRYIKKAYT
jgi:UDP-N-acetylglucosamine 3-dehydrogenase